MRQNHPDLMFGLSTGCECQEDFTYVSMTTPHRTFVNRFKESDYPTRFIFYKQLLYEQGNARQDKELKQFQYLIADR